MTELGELPIGWRACHVDDFLINQKGSIKIGPFGSQLKKDTMVTGGIKVYGQENIFEKSMSFGNRFITWEHYQRLKSCELFPGDFIISMMGTIGKCMVVPNGIQKGIMDSHLLRLQLDQNIISAGFLTHLFDSPLLLNQVKKLAVGGIMDGLSSSIVKKLLFVCPPISEQQKIAEILSTVDEKIDVIDAQISQTQDLKKGLMQRLLTKGIGHTKFKDSPLGEIPESWEVVQQNEVATFYNGRAYKLSEWETKGTPVIRLQNLTGSGKEYYYSSLKLPDQQYCDNGDLLYMWSATFGPVWWKGGKAIYHYHIWKVEVNNSRLEKQFH